MLSRGEQELEQASQQVLIPRWDRGTRGADADRASRMSNPRGKGIIESKQSESVVRWEYVVSLIRGSMSIPNRRGPQALSEILGELFTLRGYGRLRARWELEQAWEAAVGEPLCRQTQLGEVRRGVLNVTVSHPALLEELVAFSKPRLLAALRADAPGTTIHDIRFRVGVVGSAAEGSAPTGGTALDRSEPAEPKITRPRRARGRARPGTGRGPE
jgi:hypothetical protein